ncbi:MAG: CaiB/BaiF CoA transferase family protein, partial [Dehalococcoidia bacterium]
VVKVEALASDGDPIRGFQFGNLMDPDLDPSLANRPTKSEPSPLFEMTNRGKRSIAVDLSEEAGREILYALVKEADVLITNLRSSTLRSLKADYETLHDLNPKLIYGRVTAYGPKGPDCDKRGFDSTAFWSRSGLMAMHGEPDGPPAQMHGSVGDYTTAVFLFAGVLLALRQRESTGKGSLVDTSLLGAGMWAASHDMVVALFKGLDLPRTSRRSPPNPLANIYLCADGKWMHLCLLQTDRYWDDLCVALQEEGLHADSRFRNHSSRCQNSAALVGILDEVIITRPFDEWAERFDKHNLVWAPVSSPTEVISDPQVERNNYLVEIDHPSYGKLREIAAPFQLNGEPLCSGRRAPEFGESTEQVLLELGYRWEDIVRLKEGKVVL